MLDLKELERKLDEALARETTESLNEWLLSKRHPNIQSLLGDGSLVSLKSFSCSMVGTSMSFIESDENCPTGENTLAMAA